MSHLLIICFFGSLECAFLNQLKWVLYGCVWLTQNELVPIMTQTVPKGFVRAYLRASTTEQDATRALDTINTFAIERGLSICNYYIENESGSKLERPELFRLLKDCQQNDILLVEDVDRLSRLVGEDWNTLKKMIRQKDIRVVAVNVPTTWLASGHNDFDSRMFSAINDMLLDMLAAVARRDYEQRRERQQQDRQGEKGREV